MEVVESAVVIWISKSRFAIRNGVEACRREEWRSPAGPGVGVLVMAARWSKPEFLAE
jgi:hypothetical protein